MSEQETSKSGFKSFPLNYWVVIFMEFFERGSYYGMMSILSVYMTDQLRLHKRKCWCNKKCYPADALYSSHSFRRNWRSIWLQKSFNFCIYLFRTWIFSYKSNHRIRNGVWQLDYYGSWCRCI